MPFMQQDPRRLVWQQNDRYLWIEPWGENSLRVRSGRHLPVMRNEDWALTEPVAESQCHIDYEHHQATLTNGKIIAIVNQKDKLPFTAIHTNPCCRSSGACGAKLARMNHLTASTSAHSTLRDASSARFRVGNIH